MAIRRNIVGIDSPEALERALGSAQYIADEALATAAYLALALGKPLLLEGAPGVGKTEAAKAEAGGLGAAAPRYGTVRGGGGEYRPAPGHRRRTPGASPNRPRCRRNTPKVFIASTSPPFTATR